MKFQAPKFLALLLTGMLALGFITAYFMFPKYQNEIKIAAILTTLTLILGGVFLINWYLNNRAPIARLEALSTNTNVRGQAASSLLLEGRLRVLESDLDHLTSIVKDMAAIIETQNKSIDELKQTKSVITPLRPIEQPKPTMVQTFASMITKPIELILPKSEPLVEAQILMTEVETSQSLSLFLRPIVKLADGTAAFYEALLDANAKNILSDEQSIAWKISRALHVLRRLKAKSPNTIMMTDVPLSHLVDEKIRTSMLNLLDFYKPHLESFVINIHGQNTIEFDAETVKALAPFTQLGIKWGVSDAVTCMQASRLKSIALIKTNNIKVIRISSESLAKEDFTKLDVERLKSSNVMLVANHIDDKTDKQSLMNNGIPYGQGPSLGVARPVKAEMLSEVKEIKHKAFEELKKAS